MKTTTKLVAGLFTVFLITNATAQETKLKWFSHAAFSITTPKGKILLIDPWLKNPSNPDAKDDKDPLLTVPKVDYILLRMDTAIMLTCSGDYIRAKLAVPQHFGTFPG